MLAGSKWSTVPVSRPSNTGEELGEAHAAEEPEGIKHASAVQVVFVVSLGCIWSGLLTMDQPAMAATFLCIGAAFFAKFIVERSQNRPA